jgi:hypothetical protein
MLLFYGRPQSDGLTNKIGTKIAFSAGSKKPLQGCKNQDNELRLLPIICWAAIRRRERRTGFQSVSENRSPIRELQAIDPSVWLSARDAER